MPSKDMFKATNYDSLDKQVDGTHYKGMKIQHLKKQINRNNEKLNEIYTSSVDSIQDDDGTSSMILKEEIKK